MQSYTVHSGGGARYKTAMSGAGKSQGGVESLCNGSRCACASTEDKNWQGKRESKGTFEFSVIIDARVSNRGALDRTFSQSAVRMVDIAEPLT